MIRKVCGCLMLALGGMCLVAGTSDTAVADGSTSSTTDCFATTATTLAACRANTCTVKTKTCDKVGTEELCGGC